LPVHLAAAGGTATTCASSRRVAACWSTSQNKMTCHRCSQKTWPASAGLVAFERNDSHAERAGDQQRRAVVMASAPGRPGALGHDARWRRAPPPGTTGLERSIFERAQSLCAGSDLRQQSGVSISSTAEARASETGPRTGPPSASDCWSWRRRPGGPLATLEARQMSGPRARAT